MDEFNKQFFLARSLYLEQQNFVLPAYSFSFKLDSLSEQEQRIAGLVLRGYSYTEIAKTLNIQPNTVKTHKKRIYSKLNINSKRELFAVIGHYGKAD